MAIRLCKQFFLALISLLIVVPFASAEGTRTWEQSKFEDLSKGTATGVAIRSTRRPGTGARFQGNLDHPVHLHMVDRG